VPPLGSLALMLAERGCRGGQRLISWRVMINEHAEKLRVKDGYYTHFRLVGVSAQSAGSRRSDVTNVYEPYRWVCGSRHQTLTAPDTMRSRVVINTAAGISIRMI
jgi:hypothetical protein